MNYEKEMKTVPGFKPPGGGIWIPEADANLERVLGEENDKNLRLRFLSYGLPVRLYEILKKSTKRLLRSCLVASLATSCAGTKGSSRPRICFRQTSGFGSGRRSS